MSGLHLVALPHTTLDDSSLSCAYSQKVRKAVGMFRDQGHYVTLYGPDVIDCDPDEYVVIATQDDRERWGFGDGFDTALTPFVWEGSYPYWAITNARAAAAVRERADDRDLLLLTTSVQSPIADANPNLTVAEWAVGYEGIHERRNWYACFESAAWRNHVYGIKAGQADARAWYGHANGAENHWRNGRAFDTVIPNFFDLDQFRLEEKGDYLLYVGRMVARKGPHIASEIAKRAGTKLVLAGPGDVRIPNRAARRKGVVATADGVELVGEVEYVGEVGVETRAELMAGARALLVPTVYVEPFGGVAVEAMLSGTPVVASDWGAFPETVTAETGARFSTLAQAEDALEYALTLDPGEIRSFAASRYTLEAVGPRYRDWFETLDSLWEEGYYAPRKTYA